MTYVDFPRDFSSLALIVVLLGMKHGFDADHLTAIDGLARYNARTRPRLARAAGALFALGHGLVIGGLGAGAAVFAQEWRMPAWIDALSAWLSIAILTLLALLNIVAVLRTPCETPVTLVGWRSGVFARLLRTGNPFAVMLVGTVFALSFDTVSHASLFAAMGVRFDDWRVAFLLAMLFVAGMLITDGANGLWIARLISSSDRTARVSSRALALTVSGLGLLTAGLTLMNRMMPALDVWTQGKELWFGAAVFTVISVSYAIGQHLARKLPVRSG